jgi:hypothetical protein
MGAKDKGKSGVVISFDHKDKERTNHDKVQVCHQRLRGCSSQNLTPELVHVLFSSQIDSVKTNWGYEGLPVSRHGRISISIFSNQVKIPRNRQGLYLQMNTLTTRGQIVGG